MTVMRGAIRQGIGEAIDNKEHSSRWTVCRTWKTRACCLADGGGDRLWLDDLNQG